jgi:hypothetical protein
MPTFPNRCQHIKVNGTQCGCPALRRNKLCYFHKRHHDERVQLNLDRMRNDRMKDDRLKADQAKGAQQKRRRVTIDLPVLEDANSIQVSLMQIMRLIITGELDSKTAGLLLYALQTASANLSRTTFEPDHHDVILNPAEAGETLLGESVWEDEDYEEEEDQDEEEGDEIDSVKEAGIRKAAEFLYSLDVKREAHMQAAKAAAAMPPEPEPTANQPPPKKPPVPEVTGQQVRDQIRQALPGILQNAASRSG